MIEQEEVSPLTLNRLSFYLRCLRHLQRESPANGEEGAIQHRHTLNLLEEGLLTWEQ